MFLKRSIIALIIISIAIVSLAFVNIARADEEDPAGDEEGTFISVAPDALIVLDLSGSMNFGPKGDENYIYGSSTSCTSDTTNCTGYNCSGGFCSKSTTSCGVDCTRLTIAKRALFNILDDDNNNVINKSDSDSMGIRIGFMRFKDIGDGQSGNDTGNDYTRGSIKLVTKISELGKETGTSYSLTFCGSSSSCNLTTIKSSCSSGSESIACENATGGTPLASALLEARKYLDDHKTSDTAKDCRQKFVILITDGADTFSCSGNGSECQEHMYKRRREVVAAARALFNNGYKVFVIGFGSGMPDYLSNTLNWMAFHGGTDNTLTANSGNTSAYGIAAGSTYPSGITSCSADSANETATCYSSGSSSSTDHFKTTNSDPGYSALSGYAFIASTSDELQRALSKAMLSIKASTYSFTQSSIQAVRTTAENYVYEASFEPSTLDPFWIGHLKRFRIDDNGYITTAANWDAGAILQGRSGSTRNIFTLNSTNGIKNFSSVSATDLDVSTSAKATDIINFITNGELDSSHTYYGWKLGDVFHTSPLSIGTPNTNFYDTNDTNYPTGFQSFADGHPRTVDNNRIVIVGANDGQMHAFKAQDGVELWSFVPPNLLSLLQIIEHTAHTASLPDHEYYVDGPLSASDIWIGQGTETIGSTAKSENQWHTYLVMSEGRGGMPTLWSSASGNCNSDFSRYYSMGSSTYGNYCGIYAFDITNATSTPSFLWRLGGNTSLSSDVAPYLGQAWSKMAMGRVRVNNVEKWVGFIGGGYSGNNCTGSTCDTRGKGFFVVNMSDGTILKSFTRGSGNVTGTINYDLAAAPTLADFDGDGFIDTAYIGDLGGNIWRFKFCMESDPATCNEGSWSGSMLFSNSDTDAYGNKSIYTATAVSFDASYNLWVFAGTGNKTDPTGTQSKGRVVAIKDSDRSKTSSYTLGDLTNCNGWYYNLAGTGEKILAEPVVYDQKVYFTSYLPATGSSSCSVSGTAKLYILEYGCGAVLSSQVVGNGISSAPVISYNPYTKGKDVYVCKSEEANVSTKVHTVKISDPTPDNTPPKTMRFWKDMRVQ